MAFTSLETAETTAKSRVADHTYIEAYAVRGGKGEIGIRALIPVVDNFGNASTYPADSINTVGSVHDGGWNFYTT